MTIEKLKELYEAEPFRPFVIRLADGRSVPVVHREFMAAAPSGRIVTVFQPDDRLNIIDAMLVTDLKMVGNGASH